MGAQARTRVVCVRTGLVLARDGGALPKMLPPFRLGAGGPVGSGRQYWPWIHQQDWIDLVRFAIRHAAVTGPLNATAPAPVTNAPNSHARSEARSDGAGMAAGPGIRLEMAAGRDGGGAPALGTAGRPGQSGAARLASFAFKQLDDALRAILGR